jgi:hypothetical protein
MEINKDYKIIDNFLDKNIFLNIKNIMESSDFNWFLQKKVNKNHYENDLTSYFTHMFFIDHENEFNISKFFNLIIPILTKINMNKLIRIKGNLYLNKENKEIHKKHVDYEFNHGGAIYYVNTNDGLTILNEKIKINSIENRLLLFNPSIPHSSTATTDSKFRININFNFM